MSDDLRDPKDPRRQKPTVEPLGDLQWARIERSVWAELDAAEAPMPAASARAGRWGIALGLAGAAVAAAAAIAVLVTSGPRQAPAPVAAAPEWVVTDVGSSRVTFGDASVVVAPRSAVLMSGDAERGVLIAIERGSAQFEVAPRKARPKFVVQAGEVTVRVIGTEFSVAREGDRAKVHVLRGTVEVTAPGETVDVTAGGSWPTQVAATPAPAPAANDDTAAPATPTTPTTIDMPAAIATPRPHHVTAPAVPAAATTTTPAPIPDDVDARRFAAAAAIEAGNPGAALAEYHRLAAGGGAWAANALYAAARLEYDHHHDDAARAALADYLRRFPHGVNAADARALLARLDHQP